MPHFLIKKEEIKDDCIELVQKENLFHITRVLRAKAGETIKFIDDEQNTYICKIIETDKSTLKAQILKKTKSQRILNNNLCLIQSVLASAEAQNLAVANAVQCGVKEIFPVISDNTSVSLKALKNKTEKWDKIVLENFKQCERADIPKIKEILTLKEAMKEFKKENTLIFAERYENTTLDMSVKNIDKNSKIAIVIGPEGGFSDKEFEYFIKENYKLITLGKMILKAPNAITASIANIVSRIE